jgi:hypothetical protein
MHMTHDPVEAQGYESISPALNSRYELKPPDD